MDNETTMSLKDFIDTFDMEDEDFPKEIWKDVQKNYIDDVVEFAREHLDMVCEVVYVQEDHEISRHTVAFLTKRACEEYINKFGYNHNHHRTYAMTAYRNFELARLLDIIQTMNFDEIPMNN